MRKTSTEAVRKWRKNNPEANRRARLKTRYGITPEEHAVLLALGCGICGTKENLRIDHDHKTGKVRGALCSKHNVGLGQFDDDPDTLRRAIRWIEEHR